MKSSLQLGLMMYVGLMVYVSLEHEGKLMKVCQCWSVSKVPEPLPAHVASTGWLVEGGGVSSP